MKGDDGYYLIHCYEGNDKLFSLSGQENFTKKERIGLLALRDAVQSVEEEGGLIYTDSDYAYDCIKGGDHRKNKDVMHALMSAMSKRVQVQMVKKSDKCYRLLGRELQKTLSLS